VYGYAHVIVVGNLVRAPEIRYTPDGKRVGKFSVAVNETRINKETGEKINATSFWDVEVWEKLCEVVLKWKQGDPVLVAGKGKQERWEKNGEKRNKTIIKASDVRFLGARPLEGEAPLPASSTSTPPAKVLPVAKPAPKPPAPAPNTTAEDLEFPDDDIPF